MGNIRINAPYQYKGDLVVDPYTQASKGCVRLVVNAYFDAGAVRDEAFVAVTEA